MTQAGTRRKGCDLFSAAHNVTEKTGAICTKVNGFILQTFQLEAYMIYLYDLATDWFNQTHVSSLLNFCLKPLIATTQFFYAFSVKSF